MPLLDHFRPPISEHHRWESFHSNWATRIADALVEDLPHGFAADEQTQSPIPSKCVSSPNSAGRLSLA